MSKSKSSSKTVVKKQASNPATKKKSSSSRLKSKTKKVPVWPDKLGMMLTRSVPKHRDVAHNGVVKPLFRVHVVRILCINHG